MKYGIEHIAMLYLLVVLFFASTGVNIYASYCGCSQLYGYSLTEPETCCQAHAHNSCRIDLEHKTGVHDTEIAKDCCSKQKVSLKIESEFMVSSSVAVPVLAVIHALFGDVFFSVETFAIDKSIYSDFDMIKPLLHGKGLVCFLQSYKIPDSI